MDIQTAKGFLVRISDHRRAEQGIWDEMRAHPDYQPHEDNVISEALDALDMRNMAEETANAAMESFNFVPDPDNEGEFVHRDELARRNADNA